jgi:hypothetical protein
MSRINPLALLVCVVLHAVLGMLWFGTLFSNTWMTLLGKSMADLQNGAGSIAYVYSILQSIVMALFLAWLLKRLFVKTAMEGMRTGFIVGFATIFVSAVTNYTFALRPMQLALIDSLYPVLSLTLMGAVIGGWQKKSVAPQPKARVA